MTTKQALPTETELQALLIERIAAQTGVDASQVDRDRPLSEYGLDSVRLLSLSGEIEDEYAVEVDPALMWDYPTVSGMASALVAVIAAADKAEGNR